MVIKTCTQKEQTKTSREAVKVNLREKQGRCVSLVFNSFTLNPSKVRITAHVLKAFGVHLCFAFQYNYLIP